MSEFKTKILPALACALYMLPTKVHAEVDLFGSDYENLRNISGSAYPSNATIKSVSDIFNLGLYILKSWYGFVVALAGFVLVYSIIQYGVSGGNSKRTEESKRNILVALLTFVALGATPFAYSFIVMLLNI